MESFSYSLRSDNKTDRGVTMFKLESARLKREFKITNGNFYASQIMNKCSEMGFVPDGNGCEFVVFFTDGTEVSSKGLPVVHSSEENERLKFVFAEDLGTTVTLEYWVHADGNTVCKQITISQNNDKVIDRVFLENIGIINSKTHFGIDPATHKEGADFVTSLGQPFYIDSLFFGCESPAVDSKIIHGAGQIRYYIGKNVGKDFKCPVTVMGGGSDNTMQAMQKAFFEYIDFISVPAPLRFECIDYNADKKALPEEVSQTAGDALKRLNAPDMPHFAGYTLANAFWASDKGEFWEFGKKFTNGFAEISAACRNENAALGVHLDLAGNKKLAKKIQKAGNGCVHSDCDELCCASSRYNEKLREYLNSLITAYNLGTLMLSFGRSEEFFCTDESHDHTVGGKNEMYYVNDLIENRMELVKSIRNAHPDINILLYGMHDVSPFWRQWVNAVDKSAFADFKKELSDELSPVEWTISMNDSVYYNTLCRHALQLPADSMRTALRDGNYSNDEFYKFAMWSTVSGEGMIQLDTEMTMLDDIKRDKLSKALKFKADNQHILKSASFIGGNPAEGNIYGFVSWTDDEGIIALRNPSEEKTDLTLTLNALMGVPEGLGDLRRENIYSLSVPETSLRYSYGDKIDLSLYPYECVIFKFTKED